MDPLTEEQLEAMYKGLLEAPPSELGDPALAAPSALLLGDKSAEEAAGRRTRLAEVQERFKVLELAEEGEGVAGALASKLSARLKVGEEVSGATSDPPTTEIASVDASLPKQLLQTLLRHSDDSKLPASPSIAGMELAESVPSGLIVESEWKDLLLACVSSGAQFLRLDPLLTSAHAG